MMLRDWQQRRATGVSTSGLYEQFGRASKTDTNRETLMKNIENRNEPRNIEKEHQNA
jgi:hypothetical protein